jgi:hypothetical protein
MLPSATISPRQEKSAQRLRPLIVRECRSIAAYDEIQGRDLGSKRFGGEMRRESLTAGPSVPELLRAFDPCKVHVTREMPCHRKN